MSGDTWWRRLTTPIPRVDGPVVLCLLAVILGVVGLVAALRGDNDFALELIWSALACVTVVIVRGARGGR